MDKKVTIASAGYSHCATEIRVNDANPLDIELPLTVSIRNGAVHLQTYATREECRALAAALLAVANCVPEAVPA